MIIEVIGKEIEKIKGDFESYLNGLNMVGEISYSQYSELYDEGTKQIQRAYELGRAELEAEVKEWKDKADLWCKTANLKDHNIMINKELEKENAELKAELSENKVADCHIVNGLCKQLTKAKELIKRLLGYEKTPRDCLTERYRKLLEEAEQFLKECK